MNHEACLPSPKASEECAAVGKVPGCGAFLSILCAPCAAACELVSWACSARSAHGCHERRLSRLGSVQAARFVKKLSCLAYLVWPPSSLNTPFSLDFSKARKRVKVQPSEQGLSVFAVKTATGMTRWVYYKTAHFGCSWASYWWSRLAAAFSSNSAPLAFPFTLPLCVCG